MKRYPVLSFLLLAGLVVAVSQNAIAAVQAVEQVSFPASPADQLIVENDFGRIRVEAWDRDQVEATIRRIAADSARLGNIDVLKQKAGSRIYLRAFFYAYQGESVELEIRVPHQLSVSVYGANPAVELHQLQGSVRVHTQTGTITATNVVASAALMTGTGDIAFQLSQQPAGDVRLEAHQGAVFCSISPELNLRAWMRAGRTLSWNREVELQGGHLERQMGVGGPLLYLASLNGDLQVLLDPTMAASLPPSPSRPSPQPPVREPEPQARPRPAAEPVDYPPAERSAEYPQNTQPAPNQGEVLTQTDDGAYTLKVDVNWTRLNVSVRDIYTNRSIPHLRRDDFLVYEDGRMQTVETFESNEAPFDLLLLLDVSGSTKSYIDLIKQASVQFTQEIKANDRIGVAVFNSDVQLIQPFTNDRYEVARSIERIRARGGTAFYDALDTSLRRYLSDREGRKAIVVFTDGVDNQLTGNWSDGSQTTFRELFREIQETDTIIYTIFLDTEDRGGRSGRRQPGRRGGSLGDILGDILTGGRTNRPLSDHEAYQLAREQLQQIADQTGGRMYAPYDIYDLDRVYSEIADDLRIQYTLVYSSSNPTRDGSWREIRVDIRNRRDLVVRTRRGYYATP